MAAKSLVGVAAIVAAMWIWSTINRSAFERDIYSVCIGHAGQGATVSSEDLARCECAATAALEAHPVRSRLPNGISGLSENARGAALARDCVRPG